MTSPLYELSSRIRPVHRSPEATAMIGRIRHAAAQLAREIDILLPPSREKSLVMTGIEEAMLWADRAADCTVNPTPTHEPGPIDTAVQVDHTRIPVENQTAVVNPPPSGVCPPPSSPGRSMVQALED